MTGSGLAGCLSKPTVMPLLRACNDMEDDTSNIRTLIIAADPASREISHFSR